jgi:uncharacterized Zn finger protein
MTVLIPTFLLSPLRETTRDRRDRAEAGLADGSLTVTITRQTEHELRATVKHGRNTYAVVLSDHRVLCTCPDNGFRGVVCKHAVAVCLHSLHYDTTASRIHLLDSDDTPYCDVRLTPYSRFTRHWLESVATWKETCQACVAHWRHPALAKAA